MYKTIFLKWLPAPLAAISLVSLLSTPALALENENVGPLSASSTLEAPVADALATSTFLFGASSTTAVLEPGKQPGSDKTDKAAAEKKQRNFTIPIFDKSLRDKYGDNLTITDDDVFLGSGLISRTASTTPAEAEQAARERQRDYAARRERIKTRQQKKEQSLLAPRFRPDELIIKFKVNVSELERAEVLRGQALKELAIRSVRSRVVLPGEKIILNKQLKFDEMRSLAATLKQDPRVEYAEPNFIARALSVAPNDSDYGQQWALSKIQAPDSWEITTGTPSAVIAILDSGWSATHPDAPARTVAGYDFVGDDSVPDDDNGHGTLVTGVIAGKANNGLGIAGVCWECAIMPVKVVNSVGEATVADVADGIRWAVDHGAKIINISVGSYDYSVYLKEAIDYALARDVLVVAAAGNDKSNFPVYPAALPGVIAVSATTNADQLWASSNYGGYVTLSAPGENIYSTDFNGGYSLTSGTSLASAYISGALGILQSAKPNTTSTPLLQALLAGADDVGFAGKDSYFGVGRLNIMKALQALLGNNLTGGLPEKPAYSEDDIFGDAFYSTISLSEIRNFLSAQAGILKNYQEESQGQILAGADIADIASIDSQLAPINQRILLVLLELKAQVITNSALSPSTLPTIFGVTQQQYLQFLRAIGVSEDKLTPLPTTDRLLIQLTYVAEKLREYLNLGESGVRQIIFKDGTTVDTPTQINAETYALQRLLAEQADSRAQWQQWVSKNGGSFYDLYQRWFGTPLQTLAGKIIEPPAIPFLQKPYRDETYWCGVTSFFDHKYPVYYSQEVARGNFATDTVALFTGNILTAVPTTTGYNSYTGHDGFDMLIRDCNTSGPAAIGKNVLAVADGVVTKATSTNSAGNIVWVEHDADGDGRNDYRTAYYHLKEPSSLHPGVTVSAGVTIIGIAGDTGRSSKGVHLHFGVYKLIYNSNGSFNSAKAIDPYGWWGDYPDPWEVANKYAKSSFLWKSSTEVDDLDPGFTAFNKQSKDTLWNYYPSKLATAGRALYTYAQFQPARHWDNWAFWGADLPTAGKYQVFAYIPSSTLKKEISSAVIYHVYHQGGMTTTTVNQKQWAGQWAPLGEFMFEAGAHAAVRLVDETEDAADQGKVIWADRVKWIPVGDAPAPAPPPPDLQIMNDGSLKFVRYTPGLLSQRYQYYLTATVKNIGGSDTVDAAICFKVKVGAENGQCVGNKKLGAIAASQWQTINLSFTLADDLARYSTSTIVGALTIVPTSVYPAESESGTSNNSVDLSRGLFGDTVGGVDFTLTELSGLQIESGSGDVKFVMKSEQAAAGDAVIDLNNFHSEMAKIFLQALSIPNYKQHISLDIIKISGGYTGQAALAPPFEQTDQADAMLNADLAMKFDLFGKSDLVTYGDIWTNLVSQSPYLAEIQASGFREQPRWIIAATIIPGRITASQTGNTMFFEDIDLDINTGWWVEEPALNLTPYNLSSAAQQDLQQRLAVYKSRLETIVKDYAKNILIPEMNSPDGIADPRYKRLRSVYGAVAAAQWYKEQVRRNPQLPFAALVDSENLAGLELPTPFDRAYWDVQAYQLIAKQPCNWWINTPGECSLTGGADWQQSQPAVTGALSFTEQYIASSTLGSFEAVQGSGINYAFGSAVHDDKNALPDIAFKDAVVTDHNNEKILAGEPVSFVARTTSTNFPASQEYFVKVLDTYSTEDGRTITDETWLLRLTAGIGNSEILSTTGRAFRNIGLHHITFVIDPSNDIPESDETNNTHDLYINVKPNGLILQVRQPAAGATVMLDPDHPLVLRGEAYDAPREVYLSGTSVEWRSDVDGFLGYGPVVIKEALTPGLHTFSFLAFGLYHEAVTTTRLNVQIKPQPGLAVSSSQASVTSSATYDFGKVYIGASSSVSYVLRNNGAADLNFYDTPPVMVSGADAGEFTVVEQPPSVLPPGSAATFTIRFASMATGTKEAAVNIANNDHRVALFTIELRGRAEIAPLIYESGSDGDTNPWFIYPSGTASTLANVVDDDPAHDRVIHLIANTLSTRMVFYAPANNPWQYPSFPVMQWGFKYQNQANFLIMLKTDNLALNNGYQYLSYSTHNTPGWRGNTFYYQLDPALADGSWRTLTRNLQQDVSAFSPNTTILGIQYFSAYGTGSIDNLALLKEGALATVSGKVADAKGNPIIGALISAPPYQLTTVTDSQGNYRLPGLPQGSYTLTPAKFGLDLPAASTTVAASGVDISGLNLSGNFVLYESGDDLDTAPWFVSPAGTASTLANVGDDTSHGRAIALTANDPSTRMVFYAPANNPWTLATHPVLQWEMKYTSDPEFLIYLNTTGGVYYLSYGTNNTPGWRGNKFYFKLDSSLKDGKWHILARDLQTDVALLSSTTTITGIQYFSAYNSGRIDNLQLKPIQPLVAALTGTVRDDAGYPVPDAAVSIAAYPVVVLTDSQGIYKLFGLPYGDYILAVQKSGYYFPTSSISFSGYRQYDISGTALSVVTYEDGSDGDTSPWFISPGGTNSTLANIVDDDPAHDRVISLIANANSTRMVFYAPATNPWVFPTFPILQWDEKYAGDWEALIYLDTSAGARYLSYSPHHASNYVYNNNTARLKVDVALADGAWHTLTRDLQADFNTLFPGVTITGLKYFSVYGTGRVDNLRLLKQLPASRLSFADPVYYGYGSFYQASDLAVGDLNKDGNTDVVVIENFIYSSQGNDVNVFFGNSNGTFQLSRDYASGNAQLRRVALQDFNGDQFTDIAVITHGGQTVYVFLNQGDGTFGNPVGYLLPGWGEGLAAADVNNDHISDIITSSGGTYSILLGNGDGSFQPLLTAYVNSKPYDILAADMNNDGKIDLVFANMNQSTVGILLGNGDGIFGSQAEYITGRYPSALTVGDFNGDKRLDIVTADRATISTLLGNGDGTFQPAQIKIGEFESLIDIDAADFNGDGFLDIAVTDRRCCNDYASRVLVMTGDGQGSFANATEYLVIGSLGALKSDDFNHDNKPDVAALGSSLSILLNTTAP
ncbi:MAG: VCBS repeat-containing protein [Candidatus Magasanikbacteria bacterium]|nr:VCBS repeat-containing protein [Candidatus Magasanikbacteria bacterium]